MDETEELEAVEAAVAEMSDDELQEYNDDLVAEVKEFIERNSERNSDQVKRIKADREFAAGQQWDKTDRTNRGENRIEEEIPVIENPISAVVNPISAKPFRSSAEPKPEYKGLYGEAIATLNEKLSDIQDTFEMQEAHDSATYDEVCAGLGFCYATTEENEDGEVVVGYHAIDDVTKVVWDADAKSTTMADAKAAVVIELIKESEAEERFGTDIWGGKQPQKTTLVDLGDDFAIPEGLVPLLTYFRVEGHNCEFHRLIGEQVVESDLLEGVSRVPIIAFIGEKKWFGDEHGFAGLVHRLRPMQRRANYANSQMMERLDLVPKVGFMGPAEAIDDYEDEWAEANYSTDAYLHYRTHDKEGRELKEPKPIQMTAQVEDVQNVINSSIQLMQFASGISPTGIVDQTIHDQVTATEFMIRTESSQSNVSHYLKHTRESVKASGKVLAQMIIMVYGLDIPEGAYEIKVDGGCIELTEMERERKFLLAVMQFVPEEMKGVLAIGLMNTLEFKQAPILAQMMVKLLPPAVQEAFLGGDPKAALAAAQQQLVQVQQQNQQLLQQVQQLTIESQQLQLRSKSDLAIKQIDAQTQLQKQKMANDNAILLKQMELQANAQKEQFNAQADAAAQDKEIVAKAQADAAKAEQDLNAEVAKATVNAKLDIEKKQAEKAAEALTAPAVVAPPDTPVM
ncbi:hypothetical protein SAMN05720761_10610 [Fibrobacter sp. UWCM]|uniref:portal protein n=1 Tax=Fibrobacter sp. UWCM TaxID=1896208 RepID=UPI000923A4AC|nr:hypothetical protein [Fibrobacter sp. UWCM]SHG87427.1 hypothetical protein SAMN05720761_10610 [Fibrobacter sp. UWCM]